MLRIIPVLVVLVMLPVGPTVPTAVAQITKSVDDKGRVTYTDQSAAKRGSVQRVQVPTSRAAQKPKALPPQPKFHVPGDPMIQRLRDNEDRKLREKAAAECWRRGADECHESDVIHNYVAEEKRRQALKPTAKSAADTKPKREPLTQDFCKRNPRIDGCDKYRRSPDDK